MTKTSKMVKINLAYYEKKDWKRFLKSIDDRDNMYATWKEWHKAYQKIKKDLISQGFVVNDFVVNIDELIKYCRIRGIRNDGKARSQFVQNK